MKKKQVEKLINKIDVPNDFDSINSKIDYSKYTNNNKKRKLNSFAGITLGVLGAYCLVSLVLTLDYYSCKKYNEDLLDAYLHSYELDNTQLHKLESKEDLNKFVLNKESFKVSLVEKIMDISLFRLVDWVVMDPNTNESIDEIDSDFTFEEDMAPGETSQDGNGNSFNTNTQVSGIDEADVSKCDGTYIYTYNHKMSSLSIYDLNATLVSHIDVLNDQGDKMNMYGELYVSGENIVLSSYKNTYIYTFNGLSITLKDSFSYDYLIDSRLMNTTLYLVSNNRISNSEIEYEDTYYDGISYVDREFNIIKYDLNTYSYDKVSNLNSYNAELYVSNENIYLANSTWTYSRFYGINQSILTDELLETCNKTITTISIFDLDLNPVGTIKTTGTILNQFSMDEKDGYFRVVTTDTTMEDTKLNSISIYSLDTLQRVGYLNENIGLDRQIVKSVRFSGDTCYIVTYQNTDPLYEIDLSDVTSPKIVSMYKAPGWSNYLHTFTINGTQYLFGIGYDDDRLTRKISVYVDNEETTQVGEDFKISFLSVDPDLFLEGLTTLYNLDNHKSLFIYNDNENLYLGVQLTYKDYYIFKIDVDATDVVSIYKTIPLNHTSSHDEFDYSRCFLVNGNIYVTKFQGIHKEAL